MKSGKILLLLFLTAVLFLGTLLPAVPAAAAENLMIGNEEMRPLFRYDFNGTDGMTKNLPSGITVLTEDGTATITDAEKTAYWNIGGSALPASEMKSNPPSAEADTAAAEFRRYAKLTFSWTILIPAGEEGTVPTEFRLYAYRRRKADGTANFDTYGLTIAKLQSDGTLTTGDDAGKKALTVLTPGTPVNLTCALDVHTGHMDYYVGDTLTATGEYWGQGWYNACMAGQIVNGATKYEKGRVLTDTDGSPYEYYYNYLSPLCFQFNGAGAEKKLILDNITCYGGMPDATGDNSDYFETVFPDMRVSRICGASMTLSRDISMTFYARTPALAEGQTLSMRFTSGAEEVTVCEDVAARRTLATGWVEYAFRYTGIGPQNFTRNIQCELLLPNGTVLATKAAYSAAEYCEDLLATDPAEVTVALVNALKTYADASFRYVGGTPAEETLSAVPAPDATQCDLSGRVGTTAEFICANVRFDYQNRLCLTFRLKNADLSTLTVDGSAVAAECVTSQGGDVYTVEIPGVAPLLFDHGFTVRVGDAVVVYSVNAYACRMQDDAAIGYLARATYLYGAAAEAYRAAYPTEN